MLGTLESTFHCQKTFRLAKGLQSSWIDLTNGAKVASKHRNVRTNFYFKQLYLRIQETKTPMVGLKSNIFAKRLISAHILTTHLIQEL